MRTRLEDKYSNNAVPRMIRDKIYIAARWSNALVKRSQGESCTKIARNRMRAGASCNLPLLTQPEYRQLPWPIANTHPRYSIRARLLLEEGSPRLRRTRLVFHVSALIANEC